jgi:hypothetical protein
MGVRRWLTRKDAADLPAWMSAITTATPRRSIGLALTLSLANPKILVLTAAAGVTIGSNLAGVDGEALWVVAFALASAVSVGLPVLTYTVLGERMRGPLSAAQQWLERNNAALMAIVLVVIGLVVALNGVAALPS